MSSQRTARMSLQRSDFMANDDRFNPASASRDMFTEAITRALGDTARKCHSVRWPT